MNRLIVVSGPSGSGKNTICDRLLLSMPQLQYSISCTTRLPRPGEKEGRDYFFLSADEFKRRIAAGRFLEYAVVFDHYYGTDKKWVDDQLAQGKDVLFNIDVQGAAQIREHFSSAVLIFLMPPSLEELQRRLQGRATDDPAEITKRLNKAKEEMGHVAEYDYTVVNDRVDAAVNKIKEILE